MKYKPRKITPLRRAIIKAKSYFFTFTPTWAVCALYGLCELFGLPTGGWRLFKYPFFVSLSLSLTLFILLFLWQRKK